MSQRLGKLTAFRFVLACMRPKNRLRANFVLRRYFNVIWVVQSPLQKYSVSSQTQITLTTAAIPARQEGRWPSSRTWGGMRWTRQRQARESVRRAVIREWAQRARRTALTRTAKPCGPDTRGWVKLPVAHSIQPDLLRHQAGGDGGQRNSAPGRARHKPSDHCAGNAGVLRLYLYARVRILSHLLHTRPRVRQAPGIPCSLSFEG
jgi:hypothetical protein